MCDPQVPVIITKGSGRTADLFTYALNINFLKPELMKLIAECYPDTSDETKETMFDNIKLCMEKGDNVSSFNLI